jgi:hypothetical protein
VKLADITIGQDYALAGSGANRRVTAVAIEKAPETDRWRGRPTGRTVSQVLVREHSNGNEFHAKAQRIERTWADQEAINAEREVARKRNARQRRAADQIREWLQGRGVKADEWRTFGTGLEIPGWELEKFAALIGIELDLEPEETS